VTFGDWPTIRRDCNGRNQMQAAISKAHSTVIALHRYPAKGVLPAGRSDEQQQNPS